jgi:tRNA (guanine-N7-)-methyltransferase
MNDSPLDTAFDDHDDSGSRPERGHVDLRPWFQTLEDVGPTLDPQTFFAQPAPLELDIGCGRGLFIFKSSTTRLDTNFLGLELDFKEGRRAARRLARREQPNARIVGGDAREVLLKKLPAGSVTAAHVYFPDPWWKKKHMRRRLFTDQFVELLSRVVMPGGHVHSWTDVEDYFVVIQGLMDHHPEFEKLPPPPEQEATSDDDYHTSFERRKRQDGWIIHRGLWRRK